MTYKIIVFKAKDRPGLLSEVASTIRRLGFNIVLNVGYTVGEKAVLLFIVEDGLHSSIGVEDLEAQLRGLGGEVKVFEVGTADAASVLAELAKDKPMILHAVEDYVTVSDIYGALIRLPVSVRKRTYMLLGLKALASLLKVADPDIVEEIVEVVPSTTLAKALSLLDPDEVADVIQKLPGRLRHKLLSLLKADVKSVVNTLLKYSPESAGGIMTTSVAVVTPSTTVQQALQTLYSSRHDIRDVLVVVDNSGRLVGIVSIDDLLRSKPDVPVSKLVRKPRLTVTPFEDREEVAKLMLRYGANRVPVVDRDGHFLGMVSIEDVANVIMDEAAEDIALLGGVEKPFERYLAASVLDLVKLRLPWLLLIYVIESITATILKSYENLISRVAIIAAFIPLIMDTGGNVGSQASSMIVRALALGEISERSSYDITYVVLKEIGVSLLVGSILALIGLGFSYALSGNPYIAAAVSVTLIVVVLFADLTGAMLPIIARRVGIDPATLSSPLLTTIVDITVTLIYMSLATLLLT